MTAPHPRYRRALTVPLGMAMATAVAFLPNTAAAADVPGTVADVTGAVNDVLASATAADASALSYVVNVRPGHGPSAQVKKAITEAGGTIVTSYDQIGVIVVHSSNPDFAKTVRKVRGVDSAGNTRNAPLPAQSTTDLGTPKALSATEVAAAETKSAAGQDPLESQQWDLAAIKADKAHEKSLGSRKVTVGVIDTGVDDTHPDIAPNFDRAASVNCVTGKPDTTDGAWRPSSEESPHGTHVAGEIAAAKNGVGMTGVAPGVKVSGIKVSTTAGYFYTEAVVCGFMWAATHGVDVTNNSYYTDPWYFNCTDDPDQKALVDAVSRASRYAEKKGTVNVAAAGNENYDLAADEITDPSSPNDGTASDRVVDPSKCLDIPTQLPGVVTVAATGAKGIKFVLLQPRSGVHRRRRSRWRLDDLPEASGARDGRQDPGHAARRQVGLHGRYVDGEPARGGRRRVDQVDAPTRLAGPGEGPAVRRGRRDAVHEAVRHQRRRQDRRGVRGLEEPQQLLRLGCGGRTGRGDQVGPYIDWVNTA
ncbi:hypothetical protein SALBM311S_08746 [Streptomyces alboniger]